MVIARVKELLAGAPGSAAAPGSLPTCSGADARAAGSAADERRCGPRSAAGRLRVAVGPERPADVRRPRPNRRADRAVRTQPADADRGARVRTRPPAPPRIAGGARRLLRAPRRGVRDPAAGARLAAPASDEFATAMPRADQAVPQERRRLPSGERRRASSRAGAPPIGAARNRPAVRAGQVPAIAEAFSALFAAERGEDGGRACPCHSRARACRRPRRRPRRAR